MAVAMLVFEALMARTPECQDFLNIAFPDDFNLPCMEVVFEGYLEGLREAG